MQIDTLEKYFDEIPPELKLEVRFFLDEYYDKQDTHSATSLKGLSEEELGKLLYLKLQGDSKDFQESLAKIHSCKSLKILSLTESSWYNRTIENIDFLVNLSKLRILDISGSKVSGFKNTFSNLKELFVFSFSSNATEGDFSGELDNLSKLLICKVDAVFVNSFSNIGRFPQGLSNIIDLNLRNQKIQNLHGLGEFKNLVRLNLSFNKIKKIPKSIKNLKNLKFLDFSNNEIDIFPSHIFSLPKLETLYFSKNPYEKTPNLDKVIQLMKILDVDNELPFLQLLETLDIYNTLKSDNYNYITLKIPKLLQTPMLQYIEFFKDYVEATKGKAIIFDVKRDKEGLVLITNGNTGVTLPELGDYFKEYVELVQVDLDRWIPNFDIPTTAMQADIFRSKLERQVYNLRSDLNTFRIENQYLAEKLQDKEALHSREIERADGQLDFLRGLVQNLRQDIRFLTEGKTAENLNVEQLLLDIQDQAVKMLERKHSQQLEDLHNDVLTDFLRQKGYYATDQTRSGRSKLGVGELDIMIRKKDGTPFSIIEAFRLKSCGEKNQTVAEHLDKLLHDYDTAGHECNFVIVYAEAKNFERLWKNYQKYVRELNGKTAFRAKHPLIKFEAKPEVSDKSSIKIGYATHRREGSVVGVYHVFINMFA